MEIPIAENSLDAWWEKYSKLFSVEFTSLTLSISLSLSQLFIKLFPYVDVRSSEFSDFSLVKRGVEITKV